MVSREIFYGKPQEKTMPDIDEVMQAIEEDDCLGFCLSCNEQQGGCEPDARNYECESCGEMNVFGAEEILFMVA
jgi:hypothetical protein